MQSTQSSTASLIQALCCLNQKEKENGIIFPKMFSLITTMIQLDDVKANIMCLVLFLHTTTKTNNQMKEETEMLSGVRIDAMFQSCNL